MIGWKTDRIRDEWKSDKISSKLKKIIEAGSIFSEIEFKKDLVITDLLRTQEEQDFIYRNNEQYQNKAWQSVHQFGRGCDLRVTTFTENEIKRLTDFFNQFIYDPNRLMKYTCLVHDVGSGIHCHIQVTS